MRAEINRPTLAELWRVLSTILECLEVEDAPTVARGLAVAGLTGRTADANGVRVERRGEVVLVFAAVPVVKGLFPGSVRRGKKTLNRQRSLAASGSQSIRLTSHPPTSRSSRPAGSNRLASFNCLGTGDDTLRFGPVS